MHMKLKNQILFSSAGFYGQNHKAIILFLIIVFSVFFFFAFHSFWTVFTVSFHVRVTVSFSRISENSWNIVLREFLKRYFLLTCHMKRVEVSNNNKPISMEMVSILCNQSWQMLNNSWTACWNPIAAYESLNWEILFKKSETGKFQ